MVKLTLPQLRAMWRIKAKPGQPAHSYGRKGTLDALVRRHLIGCTTHGTVFLTDKGKRQHLHEFRTTMHLDGCHFYSTAAHCECGATYEHYGERDPKSDPYSMVWMEPTINEQGEVEECPRCEDLINGAKAIFREGIREPKVPA